MAKPSAALTTTPADWFDVLLLSDYTIFAAALLIVLITVYYRRGPPLPGTLQSTGKMQLCDKEVFGAAGAARRLRDLAHILEHGELRLIRVADANLNVVPPPPCEKHPHLHVLGSARDLELREFLRTALGDDGFPCASFATEVGRLADFLSMVPAHLVLSTSQCPPNLRHHRFVVLHGPGVLRTLATGYVGSSAQRPRDEPTHRLTVVSPNLLACGNCQVKSCHIEYVTTLRSRTPITIDDEVRVDTRGWAAAYGCSGHGSGHGSGRRSH